jgi:hypothetical protein
MASDYIIREIRTQQHPELGEVKIWEHNPKFLSGFEKKKFKQAGSKAQFLCADCVINGARLMTSWTAFPRAQEPRGQAAADAWMIKVLLAEYKKSVSQTPTEMSPDTKSTTGAAAPMKVNRENDPDLSDLEGALKQPQKKEALDLWNEVMEEVFINNAYVKMTKSGSAPVQLYYDRLMKAREALKHFEITKHRVIVDSIIASTQLLEVLHNSTHFLRFAKRMKVRARIEAMKEALLIVVNTTPPEGYQVTPTAKDSGPRKPATK